MRKNLLGLLAIGGALAYAHKKRGGDFTAASVKDTFNTLLGTAKQKLNSVMATGTASRDAEASELRDDDAYTSGFTPGSAPGSTLRH